MIQRLEAAIFDTDGVITRTATIHAAAWKVLFDGFLRERARSEGEEFVPFSEDDYRRHVDGVPRFDGVTRFLASRGVALPDGAPDDPPDRMSVCGLGNRKNAAFLETLRRCGVEAFASTVELLEALRQASVPTAAVSASENCGAVLAGAGVDRLFDARVDGLDATALGLPGKPEPAIFLEASRRLGVEPQHAAVFEDAISGAEAGRRGGFGLVVGVDRTGHPGELAAAGADVVVSDLAAFHIRPDGSWHVDT